MVRERGNATKGTKIELKNIDDIRYLAKIRSAVGRPLVVISILILVVIVTAVVLIAPIAAAVIAVDTSSSVTGCGGVRLIFVALWTLGLQQRPQLVCKEKAQVIFGLK